MMTRTNVFVTVTGICLALVIMGGLIAYTPVIPTIDTSKTFGNTQTLDDTINKITANGSVVYEFTTGDTSPTKTMPISGSGTISAKADQAVIVIGVYTENKLANLAITDNARLMVEVVKALEAVGISEDDMQTLGYSVNPVYNWEMQMNVGYQVTNTLQVKVKDLSKIGAVIDTAANAGANVINSITFTLSETQFNTLKQQAYEKAIADVKTKAKTLTDGFGVKITGIQSINEGYYSAPVYRNSYTGIDYKATTPIISGSLDLTVTLNVVYTIE